MERRQLLKTSGAALTAGLVGMAGCSGGSDDTAGEDTPQSTDSQSDSSSSPSGSVDGTTVQMITEGGEYYFDPIGLAVEPGTTVTFVNESGSHSSLAYKDGVGQASTTRIPDGADSWESSILTESGGTFEHTFETSGTYDYFCGPHKSLGMVGRIVVGEPGGPAEGSMPPDGDVPESQTIVDSGSVAYSDF
ncbi:plastocyanin/azurin family copper-binding protein [Haloarcula laminariae]|uniref:plastocyanin/azurin family copper-binding protein n=1 Tax=Haloarcula laminariae TaxID=2961577 RepID=UPI0021C61975|nr:MULTISPECIES: plastocyanin/azurin family copper-binding protein [Halomicroarcula]